MSSLLWCPSFPRFGNPSAIISLNRFSVPLICILDPSSTSKSLRFGFWLCSRVHECCVHDCFPLLLTQCNNFQPCLHSLIICFSAWPSVLVTISTVFLFDLLSFSLTRFWIFSRNLSLYWISHPSCWTSQPSLESTSLFHLSVYLNLLWGYWGWGRRLTTSRSVYIST
jgi:hypothetical protein